MLALASSETLDTHQLSQQYALVIDNSQLGKNMPKNAVILLSGGLDSTTCLALAQHEGFNCYTISFSYGQKQSAELLAAQSIAKKAGVKKHEIIQLPIGQLGGSALTDEHINIPDYTDGDTIPSTYVPARNTIFLSFALAYAETTQAHTIFIGASAIDYSGYPDCRPEYFSAFQTLATLATKTGVEGETIHIRTPLIQLTKAQTIALGQSLNVDYSQTVSCYRLNTQGQACGTCDSCILRKKGFAEAKVDDPTQYWQN